MMTVAYLGVGSNIDPERNIPLALRALRGIVEITGVSRFYRTQPLCAEGDPEFYNGVVCVRTDLQPMELKYRVLRKIEEDLGRVRTPDPNSPREIDLDIVLYEDRVAYEGDIVLPAPDVRTRAFIALPLLELAPDLVMPDDGKPLRDAVGDMDRGRLTLLREFSDRVSKEFCNES